jgi:hypothetical protein
MSAGANSLHYPTRRRSRWTIVWPARFAASSWGIDRGPKAYVEAITGRKARLNDWKAMALPDQSATFVPKVSHARVAHSWISAPEGSFRSTPEGSGDTQRTANGLPNPDFLSASIRIRRRAGVGVNGAPSQRTSP